MGCASGLKNPFRVSEYLECHSALRKKIRTFQDEHVKKKKSPSVCQHGGTEEVEDGISLFHLLCKSEVESCPTSHRARPGYALSVDRNVRAGLVSAMV
jgi:hypothetical protein